MTPGWMPLYQQLFLIAHDADGEPRVHPTGLSLALSAAVLAELALGENLQVRQDRLWALGGHNPHPDPLADAVVTAIRRVDGPKQVPHWLRVMSGDVYDRVSGGMLAAGLVTREPRRREQRYPQTNTNVSAHCMGELRAAVAGHHVPSPPVLALAGLVALLSLERVFGFNVPATEVRNRLNVLIGYCSSAVRDVLTHAGALIGDTAMSAYR